MSKYTKGLIAAGVLSVILLGLWFAYVGINPKEGPNEAIAVLDKMEREGIPQFTLPDMEEKPFAIASLKGKVIVLSFWATWCAPCVEEFPSMIKMANTFGGDVMLVTVAADERKDDVHRFIKGLGLKSDHWVSLWDPSLSVAKQMGTARLPETFIIDREMLLVKKVMNSFDWSSEQVIRFLAQLQTKK